MILFHKALKMKTLTILINKILKYLHCIFADITIRIWSQKPWMWVRIKDWRCCVVWLTRKKKKEDESHFWILTADLHCFSAPSGWWRDPHIVAMISLLFIFAGFYMYTYAFQPFLMRARRPSCQEQSFKSGQARECW